MQSPEQVEIYYFLFIGTLGMFLLSVGLVIFFIVYQRKLFRQQIEFHEREAAYQEELLYSNIEEVENERRRISRDLHDEIGSLFSTINMKIGQLEGLPGNNAETNKILAESKGLIKAGIQSIKHISHSMIPPALDFFGLGAALEDLCTQISGTSKLAVGFQAPDELPELPREASLAVYRVVQELINNTLSHAQASQIHLSLQREDDALRLCYTDNGRGYDHDQKSRTGLGLRNIDSRINMIHGKITTESSYGKGVSITLDIPLQRFQNQSA